MIQLWVTRLPWDEINKTSKKFKVDHLLIGSIVSIESSGRKEAARYEDHYRWLVDVERYASLNMITPETEKQLQKTSFGLMQIMGANARTHGHIGPLTDLIIPEIGLSYGIEHLLKLIDRYDSIEDAISAYNQGSPRKNSKGEYSNQGYVDKVLDRYNYLKEI